MKERNQHILLLSSWYPTVDNPFLGNFVKRQAELLSKKHTVTVVYFENGTSKNTIKKINTPSPTFTEILIQLPHSRTVFGRQLKQRKAIKSLRNEIHEVNLLITHILLPKAPLFLHAKKIFNCPWIHIEHGSYFRKSIRKSWSIIQRLFVQKAVKRIDKMVAVSDFLKSDMINITAKNIEVIPNVIDTSLFSWKKKDTSQTLRFLHISTLDEETKKTTEIIDACKLFKEKYNIPFHLTIISDESYQKLESYAIGLGLSQEITFDGPKQWEELPTYYHNSDAFILNSSYETFSIVLAESWSTGTPVICTSVGIGHNLPKDLGIQTKDYHPTSLCDGMYLFSENRHSFNGEKISQFAAQFSQDHVLKKLDQLIQTCAK